MTNQEIIHFINDLKAIAEQSHEQAVKVAGVNSYGAGVENWEICAYNNILELLWENI